MNSERDIVVAIVEHRTKIEAIHKTVDEVKLDFHTTTQDIDEKLDSIGSRIDSLYSILLSGLVATFIGIFSAWAAIRSESAQSKTNVDYLPATHQTIKNSSRGAN